MKMRTTITLDPTVARRLDELGGVRSQHIEAALIAYLERLARCERDARDTRLIEQHADWLNAELADTLEFQDGL